ncbi:cytochrome b subunit of succinate dehydrogenase, Sdh3p [Filobasidium floriforme]|uniref:cytochrome b subunit of succinate dehydrogenase, Sdh3p n=1 Tax=Filobasidium floriforme TaxID=5210 RepID=UPI001E8DD91C|nr:cytochrome b subunit of succinate dehydrogenase, Sdh3p [Filobasidium floriforme]KAH8086848.1 cytochrome b subunit of succinate dehydrogenase, Sdh3p [Filobasidium floriforme]
MAIITAARPSLLRVCGAAPALRSTGLFAPALFRQARRSIQTESLTPQENLALLNAQRTVRPNSPHLTIYQPQLTWVLSSLNRITGTALSGLLYAGALTFLLHPVFPAIDSAHLIEFVAGMPGWLKTSIKFTLAVPFTLHSWNGIRHLMWDMGYALSLKGVYATGYAVLGLTAISSIGLAML